MYRIVLFLIPLFVACSQSKKKNAPDINYYFEVRCGSEKPKCKELKQFLDENIPRHKYTITNQSGYSWPYYQAYELDVPVPLDSLMPPHHHIHKMVPKGSIENMKEGEYLVQIDIYTTSDSIPDFNVNVFLMGNTGLTLSGTSGLHIADTLRVTKSLSLNEVLLKSIVRYSFK